MRPFSRACDVAEQMQKEREKTRVDYRELYGGKKRSRDRGREEDKKIEEVKFMQGFKRYGHIKVI